jgi:hypothetical protein
MNPAQVQRGATLLLTLTLAVDASAQTAERPEWKIGDKWSFKASDGPPPVESTWTREVKALLPDGKFQVQTKDGGLLTFDGETNSLDSRGPEYSWKRFSFPMFVGKKWTYRRQTGRPPANGYESGSWEVKAYERLTVPAGTFGCFRVQGTIWSTYNSVLYGQAAANQEVTYWYCPAVKWFARMKVYRDNKWEGGTRNSESVLTDFSGDK